MDKQGSVIAVVVTYNRKQLLKECISALLNQNNNNLKILVVDNASTDNTHEYILDLIDNQKVIYENTGANLGGAGGFNFGMKKAVEMGCDYVWVMDDDCIVQQNTLAELLNFANSINDDFGFLSSVVRWTDGSICKMNIQSKDFRKPITNFEKVQKIKSASFVSILINTDAIIDVGLPIKDFFIWCDDIEYTYRISKKYISYLVPQSEVIHKSINNVGSNIVKDDSNKIKRYFYAYRNERYFFRQIGFKARLYGLLRICYHALKITFLKCDNKKQRLNTMLKGYRAGKNFNPKIEYIKPLDKE